jgi:hypothetical protein
MKRNGNFTPDGKPNAINHGEILRLRCAALRMTTDSTGHAERKPPSAGVEASALSTSNPFLPTCQSALLYLFLVVCLWLPALASAQRNEIPARIAMKNMPGATDILLTGRRGDTLHARLGDAVGGSITYDVGDLKRLVLKLPADPIRDAEIAAATGNTAEAVRIMRGVVLPALPYLDLPVDGVIPHALNYAAWLRREKAWAAALTVYRALNENPDAEIHQQAVGWLAYCHARNQQFKEANDLLATFTVDDPRHAGFIPGTLAAAMVKAADKDDTGSLDLAARAASLSRIDHELYPEAVFLAASAYQRLAATAALTEERPNVVLTKPGQETPPPAAMTADEFIGVASNLYTQITTLFPSSPFSADAAKQRDIILSAHVTNLPPATIESGETP